jgi:UDP-N-acetyl-D-mannosaminuronate dehydrogenase
VNGTGQQLTAIVERYIKEGLARDAGQLVEIQSLPEIRAAVRDETTRAMGQLYQQLTTDLAKASQRDTERLAKMSANGWRDAGIAWRMVFGLISKLKSDAEALRIYEDAKAKAGKAMRSGDEP